MNPWTNNPVLGNKPQIPGEQKAAEWLKIWNIRERDEKSNKSCSSSLESTDFSWSEQENNFPWLHYLTCISVCYPALKADVLWSSFGQKNFPLTHLYSYYYRGIEHKSWNLHNYVTQGFVSLLLCQLLRVVFGPTLKLFLRCHQTHGTESRGASPSLMAGGCLPSSGSRGQWEILPTSFISCLVLVRIRVSPYLAPYKVSRAKPLPPRAYSVKNKLWKPGLGAKRRKTLMSRDLHLLSVLCAHKE